MRWHNLRDIKCPCKVIKIHEEKYGPDHLRVAINYNTKGKLLFAKGDYQGAVALYQRAIRIFEKNKGVQAPEIIRMRNNLADALFNLGELTDAREIALKNLAIAENLTGLPPSDMISCLEMIGKILLDLGDLPLAQKVYNQIKTGTDFGVLARKYSIDPGSAVRGGQMPVLSKNDSTVPPLVLQTAFKLKPGDFSSPVKVDERFWLIKIEQKLPAKPMVFDKVKKQLEHQLRQRLEAQKSRELEMELFRSAKIKVYDKKLAREFNRWLKQIRQMDISNGK